MQSFPTLPSNYYILFSGEQKMIKISFNEKLDSYEISYNGFSWVNDGKKSFVSTDAVNADTISILSTENYCFSAYKEGYIFAKDGKISEDEITETTLQNYLNTKNYPDPDLLIRTGGEHRISNFLLWQIAYTELYFTQKLWPDFRKADLIEAIADYQGRQRRFGKTGDQIIENNNK